MSVDHSEETRKLRRKIEEEIRKTFSEEKIKALATLLNIKITRQEEEKNKKSS